MNVKYGKYYMADSALESNIKQEWDNSPLPAAGVFSSQMFTYSSCPNCFKTCHCHQIQNHLIFFLKIACFLNLISRLLILKNAPFLPPGNYFVCCLATFKEKKSVFLLASLPDISEYPPALSWSLVPKWKLEHL